MEIIIKKNVNYKEVIIQDNEYRMNLLIDNDDVQNLIDVFNKAIEELAE